MLEPLFHLFQYLRRILHHNLYFTCTHTHAHTAEVEGEVHVNTYTVRISYKVAFHTHAARRVKHGANAKQTRISKTCLKTLHVYRACRSTAQTRARRVYALEATYMTPQHAQGAQVLGAKVWEHAWELRRGSMYRELTRREHRLVGIHTTSA